MKEIVLDVLAIVCVAGIFWIAYEFVGEMWHDK
jgi:hypothetical protein